MPESVMKWLSVLWMTACVAAANPAGMNFTVWSLPVDLRYAEVYNMMQTDGDDLLPLPPDVVTRYASGERLMAIKGFDVDMVRVGKDGTESQVPLSDHYLHHYVLYFGEGTGMKRMLREVKANRHFKHMIAGCHGMSGAGIHHFQSQVQSASDGYNFVSLGSAAGAEFRNNPQRLEDPYRVVTRKPEVWSSTLHIINTNRNGDASVSPLLECPCTPQRVIDVANGTIDGSPAEPPIHCSPEFAATGNPSCHLSTYKGGWRCCEHGMFLVDTSRECAQPDCREKPIDKVYMKFTFYYEDALPAARQTERAACCDVTGSGQGFENIEYDVPACPAGTPAEQCLHVVESVQPVAYFASNASRHRHSRQPAWALVDLVFAAPHLHWAGLSLELIDEQTNRTLCKRSYTEDGKGGIIYGRGNSPGNEHGYLTGITPCSWDGTTAPRFRRDHLLRTRAIYNNTQNHTGVMGLWLMHVSEVPNEDFLI